ncbi:MAG: outer membrane protein assembly factor BamA [Nitrosomonadaceae bacterium]|nr:outer membrane protein assembly factor BamA [Nitrosomonadaceae bacterium]|tara:strand:+ start:2601 stop:4976 length:2376 start_codon:yes stop_codon:yes gene_type:complete
MKIKGLVVLIFFFYSSYLLAENTSIDLLTDDKPIDIFGGDTKKQPIINDSEEKILIVKDIRVEGIQRTEAGTIFSYLPIKVGDSLTKEKAADAIKALYSTGFFKDVRLESENGVLLVIVQERPAIAEVTLVGVSEFEPDKLKTGLRKSGLAVSRIFDRALLDKAEQSLKQNYISKGRYSVKITTTITPLERNRVGLNFSIDEGEVAKIRKINIVGSKAFRERELVGLFSLRTPGLLTWITSDDQYSKQKLSGDLEKLRSYYLDRGYLEFTIDSTQVSVTPDMQDIYITVNVIEGPQYKISNIKLAGDMKVPEDELLKLVKLKTGDIFSRKKLTKSIKLITDRLGDDGYGFANVNAAPEQDKEKREVAFTFFIDPGRRVYVRRISISGNDRTRDEVIRREIRQLEGGWYSTSKINRSKVRIDKLKYFESVNVETPAVANATDKIDVNIQVKERPTGNVMVGLGFSQQEGIILSGNVSQANIFGTGKFLAIKANTGAVRRLFSVSYTDPYFTIDGITAGIDLYHRSLNTNNLNAVSNIKSATTGAAFRFGLPINEIDSIFVGIGAEVTDLSLSPLSPLRNRNFVSTFGNPTSNFPLTMRFVRDERNSAIWPTKGSTHRIFGEISVPIGDLKYFKINYHTKHYFPISKNFTFLLDGKLGYGDGYDGRELPFFKNFFAGGNRSVRGYRISSLGPRDTSRRALGGNKLVVGSAEILFPLPGMENDRSIRLGAFIDAGTVFGPNGLYPKTEGLRYSAGISVSWVSPMGPLKVSLAKALNKKEGDRLQPFQFVFGNQF